MEPGGWACYEMVLRYAHLASGQLQTAVNIDQEPVSTDTQTEGEITNQLRCTVIPFPKGRTTRRNQLNGGEGGIRTLVGR